jgi:hypothetical protein
MSYFKQPKVTLALSCEIVALIDYLKTPLVKMLASFVNQKIMADRLIRNGQRTITIPLLTILHFGSADGLNYFKVNDFMLSSADAKIDFAF